MKNQEGGYFLYFYPKANSSQHMSNVPYDNLNNYAMVVYGAEEFSSKEARASIRELYNIVNQKLYNIDEVLDDIISDDIPF
ncbi:hypothetical protein D3C85_1674650 [compost metagenome]